MRGGLSAGQEDCLSLSRKKNVRQVCDGGFRCRTMYLATEASEIWIPSLRSSLRILGAPQIELFRLRVRINSRVSFATLGLPTCPCRTFQVQYQRTRDGASRRLLSVSRSKAQNAIEASIETAIPINVDPSVSVCGLGVFRCSTTI